MKEFMKGYRCSECGAFSLRPSARCRCANARAEPASLTGRGRVYSSTTLYASAERFEKDLPFQLAIVELDEGPRLTARIEGEPVQIGDPVDAVAERNGVWYFSRRGETA